MACVTEFSRLSMTTRFGKYHENNMAAQAATKEHSFMQPSTAETYNGGNATRLRVILLYLSMPGLPGRLTSRALRHAPVALQGVQSLLRLDSLGLPHLTVWVKSKNNNHNRNIGHRTLVVVANLGCLVIAVVRPDHRLVNKTCFCLCLPSRCTDQ